MAGMTDSEIEPGPSLSDALQGILDLMHRLTGVNDWYKKKPNGIERAIRAIKEKNDNSK